jgi:tRNA threonylcarbamoyladenosine biosynthesis protein TsaE
MEKVTIILKNYEVITSSVEETELMARRLAQHLPRPAILTLEGDLGAGKTVFSRSLAHALGVKGPVSSPTFNIVQEYELNQGVLYHMDLYRISDDDEAIAFGIDEYLQQEDAICLIEWPIRLSWLLPEDHFQITLEHVSETERKIIFSDNLRELL